MIEANEHLVGVNKASTDTRAKLRLMFAFRIHEGNCPSIHVELVFIYF